MSLALIAKEFVLNLENNSKARRQFLSENYQDSIWLQCPLHNGEPVDFWQYGPPIPGAVGFILLLATVWRDSATRGWVISGDYQVLEDKALVYQDVYPYFIQVKEAIELAVEKEYGI
jgi:hypothetical protein